MRKSLESIFSRGISIISKFLLMTFLIKVLVLEEYGAFQLITYIMLLSIYFYGIEFYMYSNREVAKENNTHAIINEHINFFLTLFPITLIFQFSFFYLVLPSKLFTLENILLLFFINISEYFSQEVYRYLIIMKEVGKANFILISKSLLFIILLFMYFTIMDAISLKILVVSSLI